MSDACMFNSPKQYLTEGEATYLLMIVFRHMCHVWKGYGCVWYVVETEEEGVEGGRAWWS